MDWEIVSDTTLGETLDRYDDITVRRERIWSVTASGRLVRLTQGGWLDLTAVTGLLRCIGFEPEGQIGWLGLLRDDDESPRLKKTVDGGLSWSNVAPLPRYPMRGLCGITVLDARTAFACGTFDRETAPGVLRTTNGEGWDLLRLPREVTNLTDVLFWTAHTGLVAGGTASRPEVLLTHDGGESWERAAIHGDFVEGSYCWKVFFVNGVTGYASVAASRNTGMVLRTDDSGRNWRVLPLDQALDGSWDLQGIGFLNERHGWVCQRGGSAFETRDGGMHWAPAEPILQDLNRIHVTPSAVYASGASIYRLPL